LRKGIRYRRGFKDSWESFAFALSFGESKPVCGSGQLLYEVYLNDRELVLTGTTESAYHALRWG